MLDMKQTLSDNLTTLLKSRPDISRLNLSKLMGVADGALGRIKYKTGNPTIDTIEDIARYFKIEAWQLFYPNLGKEVVLSAAGSSTGSRLAFNDEELKALSDADIAEIENAIRFKLKRNQCDQEERKAG